MPYPGGYSPQLFHPPLACSLDKEVPVTVTVVDAWAVPPGPCAVAMYWVVAPGVTFVDPLAGKLPNPGMFTEVALVVVQLRTAVPPAGMVLGWALREIVGGFCAAVTVTMVFEVAVPPGPIAVAV